MMRPLLGREHLPALVLSILVLSACAKTEEQGSRLSRSDSPTPAIGKAMTREAVCIGANDSQAEILKAYFAERRWRTTELGEDHCAYIVQYNVTYREVQPTDATQMLIFNTEKCTFTVFTGPGPSIRLIRTQAIRHTPNALINCGLRTLLALEGQSRALTVRDQELDVSAGRTSEDILVDELTQQSEPVRQER